MNKCAIQYIPLMIKSQKTIQGKKLEVEEELKKVASENKELMAKSAELDQLLETETNLNSDLQAKVKELLKLKVDLKMIKDDLVVSEERYEICISGWNFFDLKYFFCF